MNTNNRAFRITADWRTRGIIVNTSDWRNALSLAAARDPRLSRYVYGAGIGVRSIDGLVRLEVGQICVEVAECGNRARTIAAQKQTA